MVGILALSKAKRWKVKREHGYSRGVSSWNGEDSRSERVQMQGERARWNDAWKSVTRIGRRETRKGSRNWKMVAISGLWGRRPRPDCWSSSGLAVVQGSGVQARAGSLGDQGADRDLEAVGAVVDRSAEADSSLPEEASVAAGEGKAAGQEEEVACWGSVQRSPAEQIHRGREVELGQALPAEGSSLEEEVLAAVAQAEVPAEGGRAVRLLQEDLQVGTAPDGSQGGGRLDRSEEERWG